MFKFLVIGLGGGAGAILRYIVSNLDYRFSNGVFPVGTLVVNITGSFIIGFLWVFFDRFIFPPNLRLFLFIGLLGGYTTFSTFSLETFNLIRDGEYHIALINTILSFSLTLIAVFAGFFLSRIFFNLYK
ncbi:MAG: fluoride efflux transporter CrcB [Endomicrobiaceae bacterium]|nr:fluoride efflux transporter CrcB [Endomicrobiaceae bacterium]